MDATLTSGQPALQIGAGRRLGFFVLGIIVTLCGAFALLAPLASTLAFALIVGIAAGIAGISRIIQAFGARQWRGFFLNMLIGLLYAACGVMLWLNPLAGALAVSMVISVFMIGSGIGEVALGFQVRPERGWLWLVIAGVIALVGGLWLLLRLPVAGLFAPGVIFGIALIFEGMAFVAIGSGAREDLPGPDPRPA